MNHLSVPTPLILVAQKNAGTVEHETISNDTAQIYSVPLAGGHTVKTRPPARSIQKHRDGTIVGIVNGTMMHMLMSQGKAVTDH